MALLVILLNSTVVAEPAHGGTVPKPVPISAGENHTLAIRANGTLWAWGDNSTGELGLGNKIDSSVPTATGTGANWVAVSAGTDHSVGIKADGSLWSWGRNDLGQVGNGGTATCTAPVSIGEGQKWLSASAGYNHTLAVRADGTMWAWGANGEGQLGDGTTTQRLSPVQVGAASDWRSAAAGGLYSIGLKSDGTLWAWGDNYFGSCGQATGSNYLRPVRIGAASDWLAIAAGSDHGMALKHDGSLWTWGANFYGEIGDGTSGVARYVPTRVSLAGPVQAFSAGNSHSLAVLQDGSVWAWGYNWTGQLGDGTKTNRRSPVRSLVDAGTLGVAAGQFQSFVIKPNGALMAWGGNLDRQLGYGSILGTSMPGEVNADRDWGVTGTAVSGTLAIGAGRHAIRVIDGETGSRIPSATVTVGGVAYRTDSKGAVYLPANVAGGVTVSSAGYRGAYRVATMREGSLTEFVLERSKSDGKPFLTAASVRKTSGKFVDVRRSVVEYVQSSDNRMILECAADWQGNGAGTFVLYQGALRLTSSTGRFNLVPGKSFDTSKPVYLRLVSANGVKSDSIRTKIKIRPRTAKTWNVGARLGKKTGITVPKGTPLVGGLQLETGFDALPVSIVAEGNTFRAGFGVTDAAKMDENWGSFTESIDEASGDFDRARKLRACMRKFGGQRGSYGIVNKFKMQPEIAGYGEGVIEPDGSLRFTKGYIVVSGKGKGSWGTQFLFGPVPVYIEWLAGLEIELKSGVQKILADDGSLVLYTSILINPKAGVGGGVGLRGAASVGLEGWVAFPTVINKSYWKVDCTLQGSIKVSVLYVFEASKKFPKYTFPLHDSRSPAALQQTFALSTAITDMELSPSARVASRFQDGAGAAGVVRAASLLAAGAPQPVLLDAMPSSTPDMVRVGDRLLVVFQSDDPSRADINRCVLQYSVFENGVWSAPRAVWDNGAPDGKADLVSDGTTAHVVWQKSSRAQPAASEDVTALAAAQEIAVAEFDSASRSFRDARYLTADANLDMAPTGSISAAGLRVAWIRNSANDVFGSSGRNTLFTSSAAEGWNRSSLITTDKPITECSVAESSTAAVVAYVIDTDGDSNTATDTEIGIVGPMGASLLTSDDRAVSSPSFDDGRLYWSEGTLRCYDFETRSITRVFNDDLGIGHSYSIFRDGARRGVTWMTAGESTGTVIRARWMDSADTTSTMTLLDSPQYIGTAATVYSPAAGWSVFLNQSDADAATLSYCSITPKPAIELDDVGIGAPVSAEDPRRECTVVMSNSGTAPARDLRLLVSDASTGTSVAEVAIPEQVEPGGSQRVHVQIAFPETSGPRDYRFRIVSTADAVGSSATMTRTVGSSDFVLEVEATEVGGETVLVTSARNTGDYPADAMVIVRDVGESGEIVASYPLSQVATQSAQVFSTVVPSTEPTTAAETTTVPIPYAVEVVTSDGAALGTEATVISASEPSTEPTPPAEPGVESTVALCGLQISPESKPQTLSAEAVGTQLQLLYSTTPATATVQSVTWTSTDPSVAAVDAYGLVRIQGSGQTTVTVTSATGSFSDSVPIRVMRDRTHVVTFMSDGVITTEVPVRDGETLDAGVAPAIERPGAALLGWSLSAGGQPVELDTLPAYADIVLHALWVSSLDTTAPETGIDVTPHPDIDGLSRTSMLASLHARDNIGGTGVRSTWCLLDGAPVDNPAAFVILGDGKHSVEFASRDYADNEEATKSVEFIVDSQAPRTSCATSLSYVESATLELFAVDQGEAGVAYSEYRIDGSKWARGASVRVTTVGTHVIEYRSVDMAGNVEQPTRVTITVLPRMATVAYEAAQGGMIVGERMQAIPIASSGTTVTAVAATGYQFTQWSDGIRGGSRREVNVQADATYTANFIPICTTKTALSGGSKVRRYRTYVLSGTVASAPNVRYPGGKAKIVFKRYYKRKWRQVGTAKSVTLSGGRFTYKYKPRYRGSWRAYVSYSGMTTSAAVFRPASTVYRKFAVY